MRKYFLLIFLIITIYSCKSKEEKYWDKIIQTFKEYSLHNGKIQWDQFSDEVREAAKTSKYLAIEKALTLNRHKHSFYLMGEEKITGLRSPDYHIEYCVYEEEKIKRMLNKNFGYLNIPSLILEPAKSTFEKDRKAGQYIWLIDEEIKRQDQKDLKGWVIDLRFNRGGNMWPMLMALSPFFQDGTIGYFVSKHEEVAWEVVNGKILSEGHDFNDLFDTAPNNYKLKNNNKPVIILISHETSSAGEAVAIAFKSYPNVCFLGDDTSGFATGNKVIPIVDDEYLVLTHSVMADHTHLQHWNGVKADYIVCDEQQLIRRINRWLMDQVWY